VGIQVDTDALNQAARGYQETAAAVQSLHGGLSSALDRVAAAAANNEVSTGTASLHTGLSTALRALSDSSNQYATKVTQAAVRYRAADRLSVQESAAAVPAGQPAPVGRQTRGVALAGATRPAKPAGRGDVLTSFGMGVGDGLLDTIRGLGDLVGFGGVDGLKRSWGGNLRLGLALNTEIRRLNDLVDLPGLPRGTLSQTLVDTGKGLLAWDRWKEDPARAAGNVVFNAVSVIYGPKVVGATLKGVGAGIKGATTGAEAAAATESAIAGTEAAAEIEQLKAAQLADQAAQARGKLGISPTGDVSLDPWKPEPRPEPGRIPELDQARTAEDLRLDKQENLMRGNDFDSASGGRYPASQVWLENGKRLDGYDPGKEIVTHKSTQLAAQEDAAAKAVHEALDKYDPGNVIADTPRNRQLYPDLVGKPLRGELILEVPVQQQPVSPEFGAWAKRLGVTIRDEDGFVHN
jgi:hypothetical protein